MSSKDTLQLAYWLDLANKYNVDDEMQWAEEKHKEAMEREEKKEKEARDREEKKEKEAREREEKKEKEAREREDRLAERNYQKELLELEAAKAKAEADKLKIESEERIKLRGLELEQQRIDKNLGTSSSSTDTDSFRIKMPNVPPYKSGEDIASYLIRFESIADSMNWNDEIMARNLSLLISDTTLDIYTSFTDEVRSSYIELKAALISALKCTPDFYRKQFKTLKPTSANTYHQYVTQLFRVFDNWLEVSNVDKTFEALRQHVVRDQFYSAIGSEVRRWLKKVGPLDDIYNLARTADMYSDAEGKIQHKRETVVRDTDFKSGSRQNYTLTCHGCGEKGHKKVNCPHKAQQSSDSKDKVKVGRYHFKEDIDTKESEHGDSYKICNGSINGIEVRNIMRDIGCDGVIVNSSVFPQISNDETYEGPTIVLEDYLGRKNEFPMLRCYINCKWFQGWANCAVAPLTSCTILLGDAEGVPRAKLDPIVEKEKSSTGYVPCSEDNRNLATNNLAVEASLQPNHLGVHAVTRAEARKIAHPLYVASVEPLQITCDEFKVKQSQCDTLKEMHEAAVNSKTIERGCHAYQFVYENGLLYRQTLKSPVNKNVGKLDLVVPLDLRNTVLKISHDLPISGHFSHRKTYAKIAEYYFWPGMTVDILNFCKSCDSCQRLGSKGRIRKAEMLKMPVISTPFERVAIDIVGPLGKSSDNHRYILTIIDYASGFPEAIPLKCITSIEVAEALIQVFSRVGIPKEIVSDRGTQLTSEIMQEIYHLVGIKPLFTSPYHPQTNGKVERMHLVLKTILKKICNLQPRDWHRFLPCALFALRELPSDSTGFSPGEILYGRQIRGPLAILQDIWTDRELSNEQQLTYTYVLELKEKLSDISDIVSSNLNEAMHKYKKHYDARSFPRKFLEGDEVLILLPSSQNKLLLSWKGPYKIIKVLSKVNYLVNVKGKEKVFHVNMLKKYYRRSYKQSRVSVNSVTLENYLLSPKLVNRVKFQVLEEGNETNGVDLNIITVETDTMGNQLDINDSLCLKYKEDMTDLLDSFREVFSSVPGTTHTIDHSIRLLSDQPIQRKLYPVPLHLRGEMEAEVDKLLSLNIIEPSTSDFCNPVLLIKKPDGSYRLCLDFRALNAVTQFDCETMPNIEEDLYIFNDANFISELDITKAYYQVNLEENS